ncbi:MAG: alpha/beta fold hydrolase [Planctomycetes bacterium]|nr:alpha/beta fold hydrolase [Planctomycetota bacterium]
MATRPAPSDQARGHALLLDALGLDKLHAIVGSSLGGMQVLEFAAQFPNRLSRWISIVSTGRTTPGNSRAAPRRPRGDPARPRLPRWRVRIDKGPARGLRVTRARHDHLPLARRVQPALPCWEPEPPLHAVRRVVRGRTIPRRARPALRRQLLLAAVECMDPGEPRLRSEELRRGRAAYHRAGLRDRRRPRHADPADRAAAPRPPAREPRPPGEVRDPVVDLRPRRVLEGIRLVRPADRGVLGGEMSGRRGEPARRFGWGRGRVSRRARR